TIVAIGIIKSGGERMSNMRIYEYAKQNKMKSKDVINHLNDLKVDVSNHMSTISPDVIKKLDDLRKKDKKESAQRNDTKAKESKDKKTQKKDDTSSEGSSSNVITYSGALTVNDLAEKLNINTN